MTEIAASPAAGQSPLVTITAAKRLGLALNLPREQAFLVYSPHLQTTEVQKRYDKFVPPVPATLALRAAGFLLPDIYNALEPSPDEQVAIGETFHSLRLDHQVFAARAVATAFEKGLFRRVSTDFGMFFDRAHVGALHAVLTGQPHQNGQRLLAQAAIKYGGRDLALLTAQAYCMGGLMPKQPDRDIRQLDDFQASPLSLRHVDHKSPDRVLRRPPRQIPRVRQETFEKAADKWPVPERKGDLVEWAGGIFRVVLPKVRHRPTDRPAETLILNNFDMGPTELADRESNLYGEIKRAAISNRLQRARKALKLPAAAEAQAAAFFNRGWATVVTPIPTPFPELSADERRIFNELPNGNIDAEIGRRLHLPVHYVNETIAGLYEVFKVDSRQGLVVSGYGHQVFLPELEA